MSDYTPAPDNRPERCGSMRAALRTLVINAESAAKFYADPDYHASLLAAMQEIAKYATEVITADDDRSAASQAEFEKWLGRDAGRCATCHRSAHYSNDAPGNHGHPYAAPMARIDYPRTVRNSFTGLAAGDAAGVAALQLRIESPADAATFLANAREQGRWDNGWGYILYHAETNLYSIYAYEPVTP